MEQLLQGKQVLLTGAGRNISRSIALEMAAQGASIYFVDIDEAQGETLEKELRETGAKAQFRQVDVSDISAIDKLLRHLAQEKIQIDILVNSVGVDSWQMGQTKRDEIDVEIWHRVINTNLLGPLYLTRMVSKNMIETGKGGSILFLSSIHQWFYKGDTIYSGSKAAVGMVIEELAVQLAPHNIRVNGIAPGYVRHLTGNEKGKNLPLRNTPLRQQAVEPCYIGRAAVYLASDYFSYCTTGTILKVDGGLSLVNYLAATGPMPSSNHWLRRLARRYRRKFG
ncbi:glucose 1-dehydrogenase B [Abditibacteriota bacterium]|nr:glucose 1-dehydrogenase B [Abditibacteriota bacterium]